jgi:two-component system response regulator MprA
MDAIRAERLLLVDNETRSARILAKMLREDGFDVEVTYDGASAISRLGRKPVPDALLTDYRMATVDGVTVAKYARSISPTMPIVFLTGYPHMVSSRVESLGAEVHAKPLDYPRLKKEVRRLLDQRATEDVARVLHNSSVMSPRPSDDE